MNFNEFMHCVTIASTTKDKDEQLELSAAYITFINEMPDTFISHINKAFTENHVGSAVCLILLKRNLQSEGDNTVILKVSTELVQNLIIALLTQITINPTNVSALCVGYICNRMNNNLDIIEPILQFTEQMITHSVKLQRVATKVLSRISDIKLIQDRVNQLIQAYAEVNDDIITRNVMEAVYEQLIPEVGTDTTAQPEAEFIQQRIHWLLKMLQKLCLNYKDEKCLVEAINIFRQAVEFNLDICGDVIGSTFELIGELLRNDGYLFESGVSVLETLINGDIVHEDESKQEFIRLFVTFIFPRLAHVDSEYIDRVLQSCDPFDADEFNDDLLITRNCVQCLCDNYYDVAYDAYRLQCSQNVDDGSVQFTHFKILMLDCLMQGVMLKSSNDVFDYFQQFFTISTTIHDNDLLRYRLLTAVSNAIYLLENKAIAQQLYEPITQLVMSTIHSQCVLVVCASIRLVTNMSTTYDGYFVQQHQFVNGIIEQFVSSPAIQVQRFVIELLDSMVLRQQKFQIEPIQYYENVFIHTAQQLQQNLKLDMSDIRFLVALIRLLKSVLLKCPQLLVDTAAIINAILGIFESPVTESLHLLPHIVIESIGHLVEKYAPLMEWCTERILMHFETALQDKYVTYNDGNEDIPIFHPEVLSLQRLSLKAISGLLEQFPLKLADHVESIINLLKQPNQMYPQELSLGIICSILKVGLEAGYEEFSDCWETFTSFFEQLLLEQNLCITYAQALLIINNLIKVSKWLTQAETCYGEDLVEAHVYLFKITGFCCKSVVQVSNGNTMTVLNNKKLDATEQTIMVKRSNDTVCEVAEAYGELMVAELAPFTEVNAREQQIYQAAVTVVHQAKHDSFSAAVIMASMQLKIVEQEKKQHLAAQFFKNYLPKFHILRTRTVAKCLTFYALNCQQIEIDDGVMERLLEVACADEVALALALSVALATQNGDAVVECLTCLMKTGFELPQTREVIEKVAQHSDFSEMAQALLGQVQK